MKWDNEDEHTILNKYRGFGLMEFILDVEKKKIGCNKMIK